MDADGRLAVCLVTGFLGSGKTSFLKHIVETHGDRRLVYLVNEFSARDVDGALVSDNNPNVLCVPGGSIFCRCLVTEFIGQMRSIPEAFDRVEGVVIEASGTANPKVVETMLAETKLDGMYRLAHVISVVDPGSFAKLRHTLPNIVAQIEAADTVLINKVDLHRVDVVRRTGDALREINPGITVRHGTFGRMEVDLFGGAVRPGGLRGDYAKCRDPNYSVVTVPLCRDMDPASLEARLLAVKQHLYRVKGFVLFNGRVLYVDYSDAGFSWSLACPPQELGLAVISRGAAADEVRSFIDWLRGPSVPKAGCSAAGPRTL